MKNQKRIQQARLAMKIENRRHPQMTMEESPEPCKGIELGDGSFTG
jgi:hypothetical protein